MKQSIIVLSVPRSGTHVVMKYLLETGYTEYFPNIIENGVENMFNCPPNDHFVFGEHINTKYEDNLTQSPLRGIYIIRDARDVAVSLAHYIKVKAPSHPYHKNLVDLTETEAINKIIDGDNERPSLERMYINQNKWKKHPKAETVRYEDMVKLTNLPKHGEIYHDNIRKGICGDWKNYPNVNWEKLDNILKENGYK